jgi:membrane associated rhomboid family serine protease
VAITGIVYFYPGASARILLFIYLGTDILVWIFARDSYHIGASGLVYGYISFLFFGGSFAKNKNMLAVSLVIMFLYGAMFWGILPQKGQISWESHLFGALMGLVFAFVFRKYAILPPEPELTEDEDEEEKNDDTAENDPGIQINYMITKE